MITFHSRQLDCARYARKNENAGTVNFASQFASSICTVAFTKHEKSDATIFKSRCSRTAVSYRFRGGQALLLSQAKVFRLAHISPMVARSPARRSRDGRATSGKTSGEMSRATAVQLPGSGRTVARAMLPTVRQDDSQDNLPCARLGRAVSSSETCETTRKHAAQQPMQHLASRLIGISSSAFNHDIQKL